MKKIRFLLCFFMIFIFLSLFNYTYCYSLSEVICKEFPKFPKFFVSGKGCYKLIFYLPKENVYKLYYTSNPDIFFVRKSNDVDSYLFLHGFAESFESYSSLNNWHGSKQFTASWDAIYLYNIRGHPTDISDVEGLPVGVTYDVDYKELIYSDVDIKYKDTNDYFFRKPPLLKSAIMQRAIGGYVYQIFMMLAVPLILFIVMICGFYKSFEFVYDILN